MQSIIESVGNTPLLDIPYPKNSAVRISAKCEWYNPSGSVKDRAAYSMVMAAVESGEAAGKTLIDATSGNTGIAYAMLGSALSIPIELALPENASEERKRILKNFGVILHLTSGMEGTDGAQRFVKERVKQFPDRYFYPDQYNNEHNWKAHFKHTGPEIWNQTNGGVTHFCAGLGTTGTFMGTSRFLKEKGVHCVAVHPDNPMHGLEGWKHMETAIVPGIYNASLADDNIRISTESGFAFAKASARDLGLFLSPSSSANIAAAFALAESIDTGYIVTILPDNGMKYLQDTFWTDDDYTIKSPFK